MDEDEMLKPFEHLWTTDLHRCRIVRRLEPGDDQPVYGYRLEGESVGAFCESNPRSVVIGRPQWIDEAILEHLFAAGVPIVDEEPYLPRMLHSWARPCYQMRFGAESEAAALTSSILWQVRCGLPGEGWPVLGQDGPSMLPLCQLNLSSLEPQRAVRVPCQFMALFVGPEIGDHRTRLGGDGWEIRTYNNLDALVPLPQPPSLVLPAARSIGFELVLDDHLDPADVGERGARVMAAMPPGEFPSVRGSKIGALSTKEWGPIFADHRPKPSYVLQLRFDDTELPWGPGPGTLYLGVGSKSQEGKWVLQWLSAG